MLRLFCNLICNIKWLSPKQNSSISPNVHSCNFWIFNPEIFTIRVLLLLSCAVLYVQFISCVAMQIFWFISCPLYFLHMFPLVFNICSRDTEPNNSWCIVTPPQVALVFPNNDPVMFMVAFYGCLLAELVPVPIEVPLTKKVKMWNLTFSFICINQRTTDPYWTLAPLNSQLHLQSFSVNIHSLFRCC